MDVFKIFNPNTRPNSEEKQTIVEFLYEHLQDYGDAKTDILKCLDYAVKDNISAHGGFVLIVKNPSGIQGITIVNETGMSGYIPENILVYIAVHKDARGKGIGKKLMTKALELAQGDVALHVEPDNPAVHLYKKMGFENNYLEMRFKK